MPNFVPSDFSSSSSAKDDALNNKVAFTEAGLWANSVKWFGILGVLCTVSMILFSLPPADKIPYTAVSIVEIHPSDELVEQLLNDVSQSLSVAENALEQVESRIDITKFATTSNVNTANASNNPRIAVLGTILGLLLTFSTIGLRTVFIKGGFIA